MIDLDRLGFAGVLVLVAAAAWGGWHVGRGQEQALRIRNLETANAGMAACLGELQSANASIDAYLGGP